MVYTEKDLQLVTFSTSMLVYGRIFKKYLNMTWLDDVQWDSFVKKSVGIDTKGWIWKTT